MSRSVRSFLDGGVYLTAYPTQPPYRPSSSTGGCPVNIDIDTLHGSRQRDYPRTISTMGPATLKHLYTGIPNYYPPQQISRPVNTLYGTDFSKFAIGGQKNIMMETDVCANPYFDTVDGGDGGDIAIPDEARRVSYGFAAYPFDHFFPREVREYAPGFLPVPRLSEMTRYRTAQ